jgi:PST family polysaccharide transporter
MRERVVQSGTYLFLGKGLGIVVRIVGVFTVLYLVAPFEYGKFAAVAAILIYVTTVLQLGVDVHLIRREGEDSTRYYHVANSLLGLVGIGAATIMIAASPLLERLVGIEGLRRVAIPFFLGVPLFLLSIVPRARLERALEFKKVALIELSCQVIYYATAISLALAGMGVWALVIGWWTMVLAGYVLLSWHARLWPGFRWMGPALRDMLRFGLGYSSAVAALQLRLLVNPLVVAPILGAEAVAVIAVMQNLVETLSLPKEVLRRMSVSVLSKAQRYPARALSFISRGMVFLVVSLGFMYLAFAQTGHWVLPLVLRQEYLRILDIFPFVALGLLASHMFTAHIAALHVVRRNLTVTAFYLCYNGLLITWAWALVPSMGLLGYALAYWGAIPALPILHSAVARQIGVPRYAATCLWLPAFAFALLIGVPLPYLEFRLGWWAAFALLLPLLYSPARAQIAEMVAAFLDHLHLRRRLSDMPSRVPRRERGPTLHGLVSEGAWSAAGKASCPAAGPEPGRGQAPRQSRVAVDCAGKGSRCEPV